MNESPFEYVSLISYSSGVPEWRLSGGHDAPTLAEGANYSHHITTDLDLIKSQQSKVYRIFIKSVFLFNKFITVLQPSNESIEINRIENTKMQ